MISKVKAAVSGLVGSLSSKHSALPGPCTPEKEPPTASVAKPQPPCRPPFLKLTPEESHKLGDHNSRIVRSLKSPTDLYWGTGYAEVINAGKSHHNEDQACCEFVTIEERDGGVNSNESQTSDVQEDTKIHNGLSFYYWGLFDGHAGYGCSLAASRLLHLHICDQLRDLVNILHQPTIAAPLCLDNEMKNEIISDTPTQEKMEPPLETALRFHLEKQVFPESLVIGALENAFRQMATSDLQEADPPEWRKNVAKLHFFPPDLR